MARRWGTGPPDGHVHPVLALGRGRLAQALVLAEAGPAEGAEAADVDVGDLATEDGVDALAVETELRQPDLLVVVEVHDEVPVVLRQRAQPELAVRQNDVVVTK
jgi:hypothetical protein